MTVGELMDILENYDEDTRVVIGVIRRCGSKKYFAMDYFAMDICEVEECKTNIWDDDNDNAVVITEGMRIGSVD